MRECTWAYYAPDYLSLVSLIRLPIITMVIGVSFVFALIGYLELDQIYERANHNLEEAIRDRHKTEIQHIVEAVAATIEATVAKSIGPQLSPYLQEKVKQMIRGARFDVENAKLDVWNGYFFLYDMEGRCVAHGLDRDKEDQTLIELSDEDGVQLVRQLRDKSKHNGGGFVEYKWRKPGQGGTSSKIGYAKSLGGDRWWLEQGSMWMRLSM